jgi:hypothetical protein
MHSKANSLLKGSANVNGSTAKDWHAALRHTFLVTSGTVSTSTKIVRKLLSFPILNLPSLQTWHLLYLGFIH